MFCLTNTTASLALRSVGIVAVDADRSVSDSILSNLRKEDPR